MSPWCSCCCCVGGVGEEVGGEVWRCRGSDGPEEKKLLLLSENKDEAAAAAGVG